MPGKGRILTAISNFWFRMMTDIVPNHLGVLGAGVAQGKAIFVYPQAAPNADGETKYRAFDPNSPDFKFVDALIEDPRSTACLATDCRATPLGIARSGSDDVVGGIAVQRMEFR